MSSGGKGAAATSRVSIPGHVKKTIENLKEMTGQNHSDYEIYAMLKDCSMDPNETAQKLLQLDTFHEVKRKHNRRKEHLNKEPAGSNSNSRWKPGVASRVSKGGRGSHSSRYSPHDTGSGRNYTTMKENASSQFLEKGVNTPLPTLQESIRNETSMISPTTASSNGTSDMSSNTVLNETHAGTSRGVNPSDSTGDAGKGKLEGPPPLLSTNSSSKNPDVSHGKADTDEHQMLTSINSSEPIHSATSSEAHISSTDPVALPSQNVRPSYATGTVRHEMESVHAPVHQVNRTQGKSSPASVSSSIVPQMANIFQGGGKNQTLESPKTASSTRDGSFISRPSSNHSNRTQAIGPQKVGTAKEWKPKSGNLGVGHGSTDTSTDVSTVVEKHSELRPTPGVPSSGEVTLELERKLEQTHISDSKHVIIPTHLHVPDAEKLGFCFGSFDAGFELLDMSCNEGPKSEKNQPRSEFPEVAEETVKEPSPRQNELVTPVDTEVKYPDNPLSSMEGVENSSSAESEVSSPVLLESNESKQNVVPGSQQHHPAAYSSSNYGSAFVPPKLSSQIPPLESSESQAHDAPQLPGFVFYRPGALSDGHILPFHSAGAAPKYNGNAVMLSSLTSQSPQEAFAPMVLSTAASTPLVTQAAGVMQSSQQPLPVFRQPIGVHLSHYPPNYIPYGPYFSPYYVPPPAVQFLSNGSLPQQPQAGSGYPTPPGPTAKYSVSQFKHGHNMGNSTYIGVPGLYSPYGFSTANHGSSSATTTVTSTSSEDLAASQIKESNLYVSGQQTEGSGVWFTTPSQDIPSLQANSVYNFPQGTLAFTPTQPAHSTFAGMYHPAQAVNAATVHPLLQQSQTITSPVDMVGPPTSVYQQPQHSQLNWSSNY